MGPRAKMARFRAYQRRGVQASSSRPTRKGKPSPKHSNRSNTPTMQPLLRPRENRSGLQRRAPENRVALGRLSLVETSPAHGYYGRAEKEFIIARDTAGQTGIHNRKDALKNTPTRFALAKESERHYLLRAQSSKSSQSKAYLPIGQRQLGGALSELMGIEVGEDGRTLWRDRCASSSEIPMP